MAGDTILIPTTRAYAMNDPNHDDGLATLLEDRVVDAVKHLASGKRLPEAEKVLNCEPADDEEWDALPPPPDPAGLSSVHEMRAHDWAWLWNTDRAAYARWMSHQISTADDDQVQSIFTTEYGPD